MLTKAQVKAKHTKFYADNREKLDEFEAWLDENILKWAEKGRKFFTLSVPDRFNKPHRSIAFHELRKKYYTTIGLKIEWCGGKEVRCVWSNSTGGE